jgi:hypothetical protein
MLFSQRYVKNSTRAKLMKIVLLPRKFLLAASRLLEISFYSWAFKQ